MARVGIVGGLGPESTIDYYRRILDAWGREDASTLPSIVIDSLDVQKALRLVEHDRPALVAYLTDSVRRLAAAGADFAAMTANTPHIVLGDVAARSPAPLVSIVEVCAREACRRGSRRLGLTRDVNARRVSSRDSPLRSSSPGRPRHRRRRPGRDRASLAPARARHRGRSGARYDGAACRRDRRASTIRRPRDGAMRSLPDRSPPQGLLARRRATRADALRPELAQASSDDGRPSVLGGQVPATLARVPVRAEARIASSTATPCTASSGGQG
jgi:hypothetical protein